MSEPVTYPGGTQWAVQQNFLDSPQYVVAKDEPQARSMLAHATADAKRFSHAQPQLVSAHITWQVVE